MADGQTAVAAVGGLPARVCSRCGNLLR